MKRDFNLIREILLIIEEHDGEIHSTNITHNKHGSTQVAYHIKMLVDEGFLYTLKYLRGFLISDLTFAGHDFLDAIREEAVWNKTCKHIKDKGGAFTLDIIKEVAMLVVRNNLGL